MFFNNSHGIGSHIITECQHIIRDWKKTNFPNTEIKMPHSVIGNF